MEKYKTEFVHKLIVPFEYHKDGNVATAKSITVKAPSNAMINLIAIIENEINKGVKGMASLISNSNREDVNNAVKEQAKAEKEAKEEGEDDGMASLVAINDIGKCYEALRDILGLTAFVDGKVALTNVLFKKMCPIDTKKILARYIGSFLDTSQQN